MNRRQQIAIFVANELKKFDKESFKKEFKALEGGYLSGVNFPLGTVKGDIEKILQFLVEGGVIEEIPGTGEFKCLII